MKRKGNLSSKRRNLAVLLVAFVLVISSMLTACGTSTATTTPETKQEVAAVEKEEEVQAEVEETTQEEVVQEDTEEVQSTEEVAGPQTIKQWAKSIDTTEPQLTIWNDTTKEGCIIENEQKYIFKEGDILAVCISQKESQVTYQTFVKSSEFECYKTSKYIAYEFKKQFLEETLLEFTVTVAGTEYPFSVTLY